MSADVPIINSFSAVATYDSLLMISSTTSGMVNRSSFGTKFFDSNSKESVDVREIISLEYIYPNPFSDQLTLAVYSKRQGEVKVVITDILGIEVHSSAQLLHRGNNSILLGDLNALASGVYLLAIYNGEVKPIAVQKLFKN